MIYFKAPSSFTGEDVVEIQMQQPLSKRTSAILVYKAGAQMAMPGEFSERAFQNGKMSLDQVEAVADLIHANSLKAAKSAALSLDGALREEVERLQSELMALRFFWRLVLTFLKRTSPPLV